MTGAAGFIGYHVSQALLKRGDAVVGVDNLNAYYDVALKRARLQQLEPYQNFKFYAVDINNHAELLNRCRTHQVDHVCHLAAQAGVRYSLENPMAYSQSNLSGFLSVLELVRVIRPVNFVFASSSSVYGNPSKLPFNEADPVHEPASLYAATKRAGELMAFTYHQLYGIHVTGLRLFTVYGAWGRPDMAPYKFTQNIYRGETVELFNFGNMKRDFTYIDDVMGGILASLDKVLEFEIINLGNHSPIALRDFVACIEQLLGRKADIRQLPMQPGDVCETCADLDKARRLLGYQPKIDIKTGMAHFVEWYLDYNGLLKPGLG